MDSDDLPSKLFSGTLDRTRIVELVQVACYCKLSCDLDVESGSLGALLCVRSGQITHCAAGAVSGEEAFREIVSQDTGSFHLRNETEEVEKTVDKTWERLLIESMPYKDLESTDEGFSGLIDGIDLVDLVQFARLSGQERMLSLEVGEETSGALFFLEGAVVHAAFGDLSGEEAFREIMLADSGKFRSGPLPADTPRSIQTSLENLLIDAHRFRDEKLSGKAGSDSEGEATLIQKLQRMKIAEKIKLALTGGKEARSILMRDSNKMVQLAVVGNPKLTEGEVALLAGSRYSEEEVFRKIALSREWMRLYQVRLALVTNPKCPTGISMKVIETLGQLDWRRIAGSKSVPSSVAQMAKRLLHKVR